MNFARMEKLKKVRRLILHHADYDFSDYAIIKQSDPVDIIQAGIARVVNEIDNWHTKKWVTGLGYHFLVGNGHGIPDGYPAIGRPMMYAGVHTKWHNYDSVGILVVGNLARHDPTPEQIKTVTHLCAQLCFMFGLKPTGVYSARQGLKKVEGAVISGHHDWPEHKTNECPGSLEKFMDEIRKGAESLLFSKMITPLYTPK